MKKNLQRFGASVLAAAMVAQSVALPAAAETTKIDSSVAQSVAASAASAASAVQSLPKFTSTADLIKQTAQTLAAQGEVHELEQDDANLEATAQSKAGMSLAALENALADAMYAPVVTRFLTYDVALDKACTAYCKHVMELPAMQEWVAAAKLEPDEIERLVARIAGVPLAA